MAWMVAPIQTSDRIVSIQDSVPSLSHLNPGVYAAVENGHGSRKSFRTHLMASLQFHLVPIGTVRSTDHAYLVVIAECGGLCYSRGHYWKAIAEGRDG